MISATTYCGNNPCYGHTDGCDVIGCRRNYRTPTADRHMHLVSIAPVMGCICPPTSEKTCENPMCPRKDPLRARAP